MPKQGSIMKKPSQRAVIKKPSQQQARFVKGIVVFEAGNSDVCELTLLVGDSIEEAFASDKLVSKLQPFVVYRFKIKEEGSDSVIVEATTLRNATPAERRRARSIMG